MTHPFAPRARVAEARRAADPSTAPDELASLAAYHPRAFVLNPVLALLVLSDPSFFARLSSEAAFALASCEDAPPSVLALLADNPDAACAYRIVSNPAAPPSAVLSLLARVRAEIGAPGAHLPGHAVRVALVGRLDGQRERPSLEDALASLASSDDREVRAFVARNPSTPPEALERLASRASEVADAIATNPAAPPALVALALGGASLRQLSRVARSLSASPSTLERLAGDPRPLLRALVAENPACPAPLLARLAADGDWVVRRSAAGNLLAPPSLLEALSSDPDQRVRAAFAPRL